MDKDIGKLQAFIANNYDLDRLEAKLNEFNSLNVLKIASHEIRHSNILAWLLNPGENHNLGEQFLKKFIAETLINNEQIDVSSSVFDIQMMNFNDLEVSREWNNIDLLLVSKSNKLVIYIENKIYSNESKGQLNRYKEIIQKNFGKYEIIPIFLTLDNSEPSDSFYASMSHAQILHIAKFLLEVNKENLSIKVYEFINDYLKTLEILTMENKQIKDLCKKIYKEHADALDLINKYSEDTEFEDAAKDILSNNEIELLYTDNKIASFLTKEIIPYIQKAGIEDWIKKFPFIFYFAYYKDKIGIILEVRPFEEDEKRQSFLRHLKKYNFTIHDKSLKPGAQYTRIFTKYSKFEDWDNKEAIVQQMDTLFYKSAKVANQNILEACKNHKW